MVHRIIARNPKFRGPQSLQSAWYRYYPCFSEDFAKDALRSASLKEGDWVLDPWNGSGTTTSTAISLGLNARGYDLNPAMALVAKARSLAASEFPSLRPLALEIVRQSEKSCDPHPRDPLSAWLCPRSVAAIRGIEAAVQRLLIDDGKFATLNERGTTEVSDMAAFFYVALFRTIRHLLQPFLTSNPTWIKRPSSYRSRLQPSRVTVRAAFRDNVFEMIPRNLPKAISEVRGKAIIGTASSESLPLPDGSANCVLGSPPYCTRIDYAVATSPELALLGYARENGFDKLRRELIGTSTVPSVVPEVSQNLGKACLKFLGALSSHASKASSTYYYKNHVQYFVSIGKSLSEIRRVLQTGGRCILVAQDSYYKDVHNDLPTILTEMATLSGFHLRSRTNFVLSRTMAGVNPGSQEYRESFSAVESVLIFEAKRPTHKSNP